MAKKAYTQKAAEQQRKEEELLMEWRNKLVKKKKFLLRHDRVDMLEMGIIVEIF